MKLLEGADPDLLGYVAVFVPESFLWVGTLQCKPLT